MADSENFECRFANACSYALARFDLGEFKEKQSKALKELILGRDTFVNLPTGSGKSLIFQAFPIVLDHMESRPQHSIVVVVMYAHHLVRLIIMRASFPEQNNRHFGEL